MKCRLLMLLLFLGSIGSLYSMNPNEMLISGAENKDREMVQDALKQKADINYKDKSGYTALIWAVEKSNRWMVKLLLDAGADPDIKNNYGFTNLMLAVVNDNPPIVELLLNSGASLNLINTSGNTALDLAKKGGYKVTEKLIENEATRRKELKEEVTKYILPELAEIVLNYEAGSK